MDWLKKQLGIRDLGGGVIAMPYYGETGELLLERRRNPPWKEPRFYFEKKSKPRPYGLNKLDVARQEGHVHLCEGESATWTLWHCGLPASGYRLILQRPLSRAATSGRKLL